jgi:hypothetical protein
MLRNFDNIAKNAVIVAQVKLDKKKARGQALLECFFGVHFLNQLLEIGEVPKSLRDRTYQPKLAIRSENERDVETMRDYG